MVNMWVWSTCQESVLKNVWSRMCWSVNWLDWVASSVVNLFTSGVGKKLEKRLIHEVMWFVTSSTR